MLLLFLSVLNEEEKSKFEGIYNYYKNLMMYISMEILSNKSFAEEAVHDAMLSMLKVLDGIGEINCHKTRGLVVLITRRCSFNKLKREKIRAHAPDKTFEFISFSTSEYIAFNIPPHKRTFYVIILPEKHIPEVYNNDFVNCLPASQIDEAISKVVMLNESIKQPLPNRRREPIAREPDNARKSKSLKKLYHETAQISNLKG